jgi:hypothetical protein
MKRLANLPLLLCCFGLHAQPRFAVVCRKNRDGRDRERDGKEHKHPFKVVEITPPPRCLGVRCFPTVRDVSLPICFLSACPQPAWQIGMFKKLNALACVRKFTSPCSDSELILNGVLFSRVPSAEYSAVTLLNAAAGS